MSHAEDVLRRAWEARDDPRASRRDHRGRVAVARVVGALGAVLVLWILWTTLMA
jgi:hypothetical protein